MRLQVALCTRTRCDKTWRTSGDLSRWKSSHSQVSIRLCCALWNTKQHFSIHLWLLQGFHCHCSYFPSPHNIDGCKKDKLVPGKLEGLWRASQRVYIGPIIFYYFHQVSYVFSWPEIASINQQFFTSLINDMSENGDSQACFVWVKVKKPNIFSLFQQKSQKSRKSSHEWFMDDQDRRKRLIWIKLPFQVKPDRHPFSWYYRPVADKSVMADMFSDIQWFLNCLEGWKKMPKQVISKGVLHSLSSRGLEVWWYKNLIIASSSSPISISAPWLRWEKQKRPYVIARWRWFSRTRRSAAI